jgi:flagellar motor switch/type III secretory pathway protein FliN
MSVNSAPPTFEMIAAKSKPLDDRDAGELFPWLPCRLALEIPIVKFTVSDLLKLAKDVVLETAYHQSSDLPLRVNGQQVGWTEFEVVGDRLAVRLTDLS